MQTWRPALHARFPPEARGLARLLARVHLVNASDTSKRRNASDVVRYAMVEHANYTAVRNVSNVTLDVNSTRFDWFAADAGSQTGVMGFVNATNRSYFVNTSITEQVFTAPFWGGDYLSLATAVLVVSST